jgi:hypothetical protein
MRGGSDVAQKWYGSPEKARFRELSQFEAFSRLDQPFQRPRESVVVLARLTSLSRVRVNIAR